MGALNFKDCIEDFPLIIMTDFEVCRAFWGDDEESIYPKQRDYDEFELQTAYQELFDDYDIIDDMTVKDALEELNDKLVWYKVSLESGYYEGVVVCRY